MLVTMGQFAEIATSGVTPDTATEVIRQWLAHRPLECQRLMTEEIGSQEATRVVASLTKQARGKRS